MLRRAERPGQGQRQRQRLRLPLRKSLLGRLLAVSALVAACSVAATAWLAVQTTSGAIEQEQGRNLAADTRILDALLAYAAEHPTWDGVEATVDELAESAGRRITLTTQSRETVADSAGSSPPPPALPAQASAVVDPLSVTVASTGAANGIAGEPGSVSVTVGSPGADGVQRSADDRIDPRAVGPFRLPQAERASLRRTADAAVQCLSRSGIASDVVEAASGRPRIQVVGNDPDRLRSSQCPTDELDSPTVTERAALKTLNELVNACLERQDREAVQLDLDLSWNSYTEPLPTAVAGEWPTPVPSVSAAASPAPTPYATPEPLDSENDRDIASCVGIARQEQLSSYVAQPALLFITDPGGGVVPGFELSAANTVKITGAAALVLALTVGASVLAGVRLVRPLHALTGAAQRMRDGEDPSQVVVAGDNEIGRLAAAFNDMSAHRARLEEQRKVMVSDVAHELRTPLSNIRGWLEGAQDGIADADATFVSSLLEEAVQLQHIIDDLQDLSAADAGALRLHPEPVRIEELLTQVASAHQAGADAAGVGLTVVLTAGRGPAPTLDADPVRLRQAVGNLVSNAVRHTPPGGQVTLRAYATTPPDGTGEGTAGETVVVEVSDTGGGIAPDDLPYVFDRFWRAEKSRSRRTGGSGLGLAIVRKLAEAHGGTTGVVSTVGQGSVFTLRLPSAGPDPMETTV